MKIVLIYRPVSDHARPVEEFVREFTRRNPGSHLEILDIDSRDGGSTAALYDITSYPAILALQTDGAASMVWQGEPLPLLDDVASYTY